MANTQISTMLATTAALALAACGGGGGGSSGNASANYSYQVERTFCAVYGCSTINNEPHTCQNLNRVLYGGTCGGLVPVSSVISLWPDFERWKRIYPVTASISSNSASLSSFTTLGNDGIAMINKHQNATLTPVQNIPIGNFNYSGVAAYSALNTSDTALILNNALAVSSIDLNANFSTNSISGSLSNFVDVDDYTASGSVPLTGSISGNGFTASGSAVLVSEFDGSNALTSANIDGAFFGNQADVASGLMSATYGGISGSGVFIAER